MLAEPKALSLCLGVSFRVVGPKSPLFTQIGSVRFCGGAHCIPHLVGRQEFQNPSPTYSLRLVVSARYGCWQDPRLPFIRRKVGLIEIQAPCTQPGSICQVGMGGRVLSPPHFSLVLSGRKVRMVEPHTPHFAWQYLVGR